MFEVKTLKAAANGVLGTCSTWNIRRETRGPLPERDFAEVILGSWAAPAPSGLRWGWKEQCGPTCWPAKWLEAPLVDRKRHEEKPV